MAFHFNVFSVVLLVSSIMTLFLSVVMLQMRGKAVRWFGITMLFNTIWAAGYAMELAVWTLPEMLFWVKVEYIGIAFLPATYITFIFHFIGREEWLTVRNRIFILFFSFAALFFSWTNEYHSLHFSSVKLNHNGPFPIFDYAPGLWYYVHTTYFYCVLLLGAGLLLYQFSKTDKIYRKQYGLILIGTVIPWTGDIIYQLGLSPYAIIDLVPFAFVISSVIISYGLFKLKLFDLVPIARDKLLENMQEGILVVDTQNIVTDVNSMTRELLGFGDAKLIGSKVEQLLKGHRELLAQLQRKVNAVHDIKLNNSEQAFYIAVTITPLFTGNKNYRGSLLMFTDITESKLAAERMQTQTRELAILNQLKDQLFSIISHDLRSPFATLQGLLSIMEQGYLTDEEFKEAVPTLAKELGYTNNLLNNLLYWSKSQLKGEGLKTEAFDFTELIKEELLLAGNRADQKGVQITNTVPFKAITLNADRNMIALVLRNLIGNAIKFCKKGNTVVISADKQPNDMVRINIADNGSGMNEKALGRIFGNSPFSTRGTDGEKGTGLGLKLCKDFVEKNGGELWAESSQGVGSVFYFTLPMAPMLELVV